MADKQRYECGLCLESVIRLVKSHIVPEALLVEGRTSSSQLLVANTKGIAPKRAPIGFYSRIVCSPCEDSFHNDDELLILAVRSLSKNMPTINGLTVLPHIDPVALKRSILSVLYRAHLSNHDMYRNVDLGSHAENLRRFLRNETSCSPAFEVILRHVKHEALSRSVFCTSKQCMGDADAYRLYFPNMTAGIKVDIRPMPVELDILKLRAGQPVLAMRDTLSNFELATIDEILKKQGSHFIKRFTPKAP